jgi:DNA transformation protein and related proteins
MASDQKFVDYVCDQASDAQLTYKKMFGEYALYIGNKVVALVCDNQLFIKPTSVGQSLLEKAGHSIVYAPPYPSAKPHFLADELLEQRELLSQLFQQTAQALPAPSPKKPRATKK